PLVVLVYREWRMYVAAAVPVAMVLVWVRPLVQDTRAHDPSEVERLRGLQQYADQLLISGPHHFRLAPEVLGRTGPVAIAALFLLPLTALAIRRRWGQYVLGGSLLILLLMEVPWLFVHLSDSASLSQARRAAGFAQLPFAVAGGVPLAATTM